MSFEHSNKPKLPHLMWWFLGFFAIICVDQISKFVARGQGSVTFNSGISLSVGEGLDGWVYVLVTIVLLVVMGKWLWKMWRENLLVFGLLCGGAISNALDRLFFSGVQDFLPVYFFNLKNNVADWVIFGCMVWVGWSVWRGKKGL